MTKKLITGALLGGFILWLWGFLYWAISGIPVNGMSEFKDEAAVERVLRENAQGPGFYALPSAWVPDGTDPQAWGEKRMQHIADRFFFSGSVNVGGLGPMGNQMVRSILGNVLAALLMMWLLLQAADSSFGRRVLFVVGAALLAWLVGVYPNAVWWGHPSSFVFYQLIDFVIGWTLAGLALAWLVGDRRAAA